MKEVKYPIYTINWKWIQDGDHDPKYPDRYTKLPEGRIDNFTSMDRMFKEEQNIDELKTWAENWFLDYTERYNKDCIDENNKLRNKPMKNIEGLQIEIKPPRFETWNCGWFYHETFDVGQTDEEALKSFEQYVRRYEHFQNSHDFAEVTKEPGYLCLMGAEDRWRWCGSGEDGRSSHDIAAPCRCSGCKEAGMLRINH